MPRSALVEFRRGTAAAWTSANPTLAAGEPGFETNTGKVKIGDGSTVWNSLAYIGAASGVSSLNALTGALSIAAGTGISVTASGSSVTVAASGGASSVLYDNTLGGTSATLDTGVNGIAATFSHLQVWILARSDAVATTVNSFYQFNGDTGANYDLENIPAGGAGAVTATQSGAQTNLIFITSAASAAANYFTLARIDIPAYRQTTAFKVGHASHAKNDSATASLNRDDERAFTWRSTAAINRIVVTAGSASNFIAGSRLTVLGLG